MVAGVRINVHKVGEEAAQDGCEMLLWKMPLESWLYLKRNKTQPSANGLKKVSLKVQRKEETKWGEEILGKYTATHLNSHTAQVPALCLCFIKDCNQSWISCTASTFAVTAWQGCKQLHSSSSSWSCDSAKYPKTAIFWYYIKVKWNQMDREAKTRTKLPGR